MFQPQLMINCLLLLPFAALAQLPDDLVNVPVHFKSAVDFTFIRVNPFNRIVDRVENHDAWETATIRPVGDAYTIVFESDGKTWYFKAPPGENSQFEVNDYQGHFELFTFEDLGTNGIDNLGNNQFGIRSHHHGTYLRMDPANRAIVNTAPRLGPWEKFYIQPANDPLANHIAPLPDHLVNVPINFKAVVDNGYLRVDPFNGQVDRVDGAGGWETATIRPVGDGYAIVFESEKTLYLCAPPGQFKQVETREGQGGWEVFTFVPLANGNFGICSREHGSCLRAHADNRQIVDTQVHVGGWEEFQLEPVNPVGCVITPEQEDLLRAMNHARALHGQEPFIWRDQVACDMQALCNDPNAYDGKGHMNVPAGVEGLWSLNGAEWTGDNVVSGWYGERDHFSNGVCWHGTDPTCGHFLAIVQDIMTDVACAVCTTGPNPGTYCNMRFNSVPMNDGTGNYGVGQRPDHEDGVFSDMPSLTTTEVQAQLDQCQESACP